ncbi:MAG: hypothetical protein RL298_714 [Pseudomonadota bacterium]
MKALCIYAGPKAKLHLSQHGLSAADIGVIPAAAGGPKGLILGPLDRFIFNDWLPTSQQPVDLVGASIGAWRMATACMPDSQAGLHGAWPQLVCQTVKQGFSGLKKITFTNITN